ncbi:hypothetical protein Q5M85_02370 [Paraclostridium bifermentans]|nr:hypothetical protein [Paraclostridium bifermentans]
MEEETLKKVLQGQLVNELIGLYFIVLEIKDIQNLKWFKSLDKDDKIIKL